MSLPFKSCLLNAISLCLLFTCLTTTVFAADSNNSSPLHRYRQALLADPNNPTLHYILGLAQLKNGETTEAIGSFRTAYPAYTDSIEMQLNMGQAFALTGDADSALLYLEQAETLGAMKTEHRYPLINAYYKTGLIYLEQGALDEASTLFKLVLNLDPSRVEIYRLIGDIAAQNGQREEAVSHFTKYLETYPKDQATNEYLYSLHFNHATQLMEKGETEAAQKSFEDARAIAPESPLILYSLGVLAYNSGNTELAIKHLTASYATAPEELKENTRSMLYNSVLQSSDLQKLDLAIAGITPLIDIPDAQIKDLMLAGEIQLKRHNFKTARDIFNRILSLEPTHPQALINIAVAEEKAVEELFQEGLLAYKKGQFKDAIAHFDEVLSIQPDERRSNGYRKKSIKKIETRAKNQFKQAQKAITDKDYLKAVTLTNEGLALTPNNTSGLRLRREALQALKADVQHLIEHGFELLQLADFAAAEAQFNKVVQIDPDNTKALQGLTKSNQQRQTNAHIEIDKGNAALDEGDLRAADRHFKIAEKLIPDLPETVEGLVRLNALIDSLVAQQLQLGRGSRSAGNLNQAEIHFTKALKLRNSIEIKRELESVATERTNRAEGLLQAARTAHHKKEFNTARTIYNRILSINPLHPAKAELLSLNTEIELTVEKELSVARTTSKQGDYKAALNAYRQVLDLAPTNEEALQGLHEKRKLIEAELDKYLQTGRNAFNAGDFKSAKTAFTTVLKFDPYQAEAKSNLTKIESLEQTGIRPGDENRLYLQGIEFYTQGKYSDAIQSWEKVLQLAPEHNKAKMNIKKAKRKLQSIREFQSG